VPALVLSIQAALESAGYDLMMPGRRRILIVEDDADLRRMFRRALTFAGFDVQEVGDGLAALRAIEADTPHAIVLDLGLPLVSGHMVLQDVAGQAHTRQIPVVVVTGQPGDHEGLEVACLLRKPVTPDQLVSVVRKCLISGAPGMAS
jgi:DNA-binding response OmpR family regulator